MKTFRNFMVPLVALLVLLVLLIVVLVLIYEQKGILLPFAVQPRDVPSETTVCFPNSFKLADYFSIYSNWRI